MRTLLSAVLVFGVTACGDTAPEGEAPRLVGAPDSGAASTSPAQASSSSDGGSSPSSGGERVPCGDLVCSAGSYCERSSFSCTSTGTCKPKPVDCDSSVALQCGCDDVTYVSACKASLAGVSIKHEGACLKKDGGDAICEDNTHCGADEFCDFVGSCEVVKRGKCTARPTSCPPPTTLAACGCDGVTYPSNCEAHKAGTDVSSVGACP